MMNIIRIAFTISLLAAFHSHAAVYENFASGEPNNSGDCGWIYSSGEWDDSGCSERERTACYNGSTWLLGAPTKGLFGNTQNTPPAEQCNNAGSEYRFAAPFNA